ncbi:hypothetical protein [Microtetraspora malaysiensis]|uniref:hypothetical protein n=1 Tax=Microtetraspora malaysiensis TaxID=161358 RepID=UPI0008364617|nr:hypothetical protein [Microtetraspora malaysiensis]
MRKTKSRLTRAAGAAAAVVLMASGVAVVGAPAASASTCTGRFCGAVKNRTGRTMHITLNLGAGSGLCNVWNWDGGTGSNSKQARCDQQAFGNGTKGGNGTGVDVDAFTFNSEGYHERFTRVGTWHWRTKGVWTKIRDGEIADCGIGDSNEIWCTVLVQAA